MGASKGPQSPQRSEAPRRSRGAPRYSGRSGTIQASASCLQSVMAKHAAAKPTGDVPSALPFIPREHNLSAFREAAKGCRGCDLWKRGTQTVFGEGERRAVAMLVGEQPGNDE